MSRNQTGQDTPIFHSGSVIFRKQNDFHHSYQVLSSPTDLTSWVICGKINSNESEHNVLITFNSFGGGFELMRDGDKDKVVHHMETSLM